MRSQNPLSTISYNTDEFIISLMEELVKEDIIRSWCYIWHDPEKNENKRHIHFYCEPIDVVDTKVFRNKFEQPDPNGGLPLGCMPFDKSKPLPWLLYAIHDKDYMEEKKLVKLYEYSFDDIKFSDESFKETMYALYISWKDGQQWNQKKVANSMKQYTRLGLPYSEWITDNITHVSISNVKNLRDLYGAFWEIENCRINDYINLLKSDDVLDLDIQTEICTDISKYEVRTIKAKDKYCYEQLKLVFSLNDLDIDNY